MNITHCINCSHPLKVEPKENHLGELVEYLCICPNFKKKNFPLCSKQGSGFSNNFAVCFSPKWERTSFSVCLGEYGIFIRRGETIIHKYHYYDNTFGYKELMTLPVIEPNLKSRETLIDQIKMMLIFA